MSYNLSQTSQTGGQRYSDTSHFSIPWLVHTLHELKWQHQPWPSDQGDVEESEDVAEKSGGQNLKIVVSLEVAPTKARLG